MVATEIAEDDQQLEVRIIRTKGGIKNVAYIADTDNALIVQQRTTSASTLNSSTSLGKNNELSKEGIQDNSQDPDIPKFPLTKANIFPKKSKRPENLHGMMKCHQDSPRSSSNLDVNVEVQKVQNNVIYSVVIFRNS